MVSKTSSHTWTSPLDGSSLTAVEVTDATAVSGVVHRARLALPQWSATTLESRGRIIRKAAQLLEERASELAEIVRAETGKPRAASLGEIAGAVEMGYLVSSHGRHDMGSLLPSAVPGRQVRVQRMPRGVAALIVTYNAPVPNYAWKAFPALMAGNTAILKPSPATPLSAIKFAEILQDAGVPADVFQVIHGKGETAAALIEAGVELVSFTGSYLTGQRVVEAAAKTLAKTIIELGGSNPLIVCDDADLGAAVDAVIDSAYSNAGQRCSSASRVIIHDSVYDDFVVQFTEKVQKLTWGTDPDVVVSTLIDSASVTAFEKYLSDAVAAGAEVKRVGTLKGTPHADACLVQPALIHGLPLDHPLGVFEFFGPATRLFRFSLDEEAIQLANASEYGLTAAVWSRDIARAERIVDRLEAGVININGPTHGAEVNMPFGGVKHSGNGSRDAGVDSIDQYSDIKVVSTFFGV